MAETTTVQVRKDVHEQLKELKPYKSTSFSDVIAGLVEEHDSDRHSVEESDAICPNH